MGATDLSSPSAQADKAGLWAEVKRLRKERALPATIPLLERLCADHPGDLRFLSSLAEALIVADREAEARTWLERARALDPADPRVIELTAKADARWPSAESLAAIEAPRTELKARLEALAGAGRFEEVISAYHAAVRERPEVVANIEDWAPLVNSAGRAIYDQSNARPGAWAQAVIDEVVQRGIAIRSFEEAVGEPALLDELQAVVRATEDWTVPGKAHFFKAVREDGIGAGHPILQGGLSPRILEVVNGFYGLFARLVSANIVQTRIDATDERKRRGSEGWHRDPEDSLVIKAFIYLNDVEEVGHGPFQYIPASRPGGKYEHLLARFGRGVYDKSYKTRPDWDQVEREVAPEDVVTVLGKAGTVFFCNTSGFHRGGYCLTQDRYMCAYVYQRPGSQYPSYTAPDLEVGDAPLAVRMAVKTP
jgi:hypothetical protein